MKYSFIIFILYLYFFSCKHEVKSMKTVNDSNFPIKTDSININKTNSINNIKTDSIMNERYDYESTNGGEQDAYIKKNGWIIWMYSMTEGGAAYQMYPPSPEFYKIVKVFYPNGNIKTEAKFLGGLEIDTTRYYDEDGYMVKEVNENKKFGTIKPAFILKFLERAGWIDLKTGKGRATFEFEEGYPNNPNTTDCVFELQFEPVGESYYIKDNKVPIWVVKIPVFPKEYRWEETTYLIDGETGKMLSKERKKVFKNR